MASNTKIVLPTAIVEEYKSNTPMTEIAKRHGVSYSTARSRLIELGVKPRTRREALGVSKFDRSTFLKGRKLPPMTEATKANLRAIRLARPCVGVSLKPNGYLECTNGLNKGRAVHRVIAEQMIGRPLGKGEVVHHKDRNRANNHPSNLEVMTRSAHTSLHRKEGW